MSVIGSPIETSLLQAAQAQQTASKAKDRERATVSERAQRMKDMVDLKVAGIEADEAIRMIPDNGSEQASDEHHRQDLPSLGTSSKPSDDTQPRIDLTA